MFNNSSRENRDIYEIKWKNWYSRQSTDDKYNLIWHIGFARCMTMTTDTHQDYIAYEGHLESKERFAIKKYLLITGKKKNMQVLSQTFTYFST